MKGNEKVSHERTDFLHNTAALTWFSCGVWQDMLLPSQHVCAVYRKSKSSDRNNILANLIDEYSIHGCVQTTFTKNIYPVSLDTVAYNGETKPPLGSKRSTGWPRTKPIRRRSLYAASEDSPIVCSNCGQAVHNKRTCSTKQRQGIAYQRIQRHQY